MPGWRRGHGWPRGRGLRRGQIARFAEACLLLQLRDEDLHGYELIAGLERFGLDPGAFDSGQLYRILRQMEEADWVTSVWESSDAGPARRVYSLTSVGRDALAMWQQELANTHEMLHKLLGLDDSPPSPSS
jgi:PadR family transcriptional regulator, regulatory protein PadR